jgi:hypothetical protein
MLIVFTVLRILKTFMEVLPPVLLAMGTDVVTLFYADLQALEDLLNQEQEAIEDTTPPGGLLQIALIPDESSMITEERLIDLCTMDPECRLWQERNAA